MSNTSNLVKDVEIDIGGMLSNIWKKKFLLLLLTLISGVIFFLIFSSISPRYQSTSSIIIEKRESVFTRVNTNDFSGASRFDRETIGSQVQILNSTDLALEVIKEADLVNQKEFKPKSSFMGSILGMFLPKSDGPVLTPEESVLKKFRTRLQAYSVQNSRVLTIDFWAHDRALAKRVVNIMAQKFIESNRQAKNSSTEDATKWLEPQIQKLRTELLTSEAKVADFRAQSDILVGQNNSLLATQQLSEFSTELSRVRARKSSAEGKVQSIRRTLQNGGSLDVVPEVIASPLIQRLRERQVNLRGQISELETTLLPNHPRLKALRSQLSGFENQIRSAAQDIMKSLENNVDEAKRQEEVLLQEVNRLKAESSRVNEAEVQLRALEREAAAQRELLQSYLSRFREAASRQNADYNPVDARIISRGTQAVDSHFPKVIPFTSAGMAAVLILSIVGLLTGQLLSGKAFKMAETPTPRPAPKQEPVDEHQPVVNLAQEETPAIVPAEEELIVETSRAIERKAEIIQNHKFYTSFHAVQAIAELGRGKIAIVSPGAEKGSKRTAEVARGLDRLGKSTVVVDLSGNGVAANELLGAGGEGGLRDVLLGQSTLKEILYKDYASSAHVLTSGNLTGSELIENIERLKQVSQSLVQNYDFVIFDCGFVGPTGLSKIADADTIVLIPADGASERESGELEGKLHREGFEETILMASVEQEVNSSAA